MSGEQSAVNICVCRRLSTKRLPFLSCALPLFAFVLSAWPQTVSSPDVTASVHPALVTFYSNGMSLLGGFPGKKSPAFKGRIFAGSEQLTFLEPAHFVTFAFTPGPREFTANTWMASGPGGGAHITIDLGADKHYFIEARTRNIPTTSLFGIKSVTCIEARAFANHYRPLELEHLRPAGKSLVISEVAFPTCS